MKTKREADPRLAPRLRAVRDRLDLDQPAMARKLGLSERAYYYAEAGAPTHPSRGLLLALLALEAGLDVDDDHRHVGRVAPTRRRPRRLAVDHELARCMAESAERLEAGYPGKEEDDAVSAEAAAAAAAFLDEEERLATTPGARGVTPVRRGDIVVAAQGKARPWLVVQADAYNARRPTIIMVPISGSLTGEGARLPVPATAANGLDRDSELQPDRLTLVERSRIGAVIGRLDEETMARLDRMLAAVLGLPWYEDEP